MYTIQNDTLKISVKKIGAELCQISSVKNNTQFMWDANPKVWGSYAPNLFPIIGALKDNTYFFENKKYALPKHGFIRHNGNIALHEQNQDSLTFKLSYDVDLLKIYPFKFEFYITYKLVDNTIEVIHNIKNCDINPMYFSLGGHPAFKCPLYDDEKYNDYILEFDHIENSETHLINADNGLANSKTRPCLENSNHIQLEYNLFNDDALIFKDLKSKRITLKSKLRGEIVSVSYNDFPYLGIWAKPNANYVCIEPWLGIADNENTNQELTTKEGVIKLNGNDTFTASYTIEIHNKHLS
ncbi:aldose 1-epimerase family protein [Flavivirga aquimarina]|uniref:Aldose 1-epimerase family protein n=1 Tax=Flavivirga aquimarina TaxID=2027862 RepID=A0ABT8W6G3_9FLAO|nr:aldose 1-epimerase family protein [Flavivirga aquimarina]MDO5968685.1 aldose 1-epimerase family protein [Flavivirga aquimarina]